MEKTRYEYLFAFSHALVEKFTDGNDWKMVSCIVTSSCPNHRAQAIAAQ